MYDKRMSGKSALVDTSTNCRKSKGSNMPNTGSIHSSMIRSGDVTLMYDLYGSMHELNCYLSNVRHVLSTK